MLSLSVVTTLAPIALMASSFLLLTLPKAAQQPWRVFMPLSLLALATCLPGLLPAMQNTSSTSPGLFLSPLGNLLATLVQLLGTVIGAFSARYLEGEAGQRRYAAALAGVLAAVHLLLRADHWLILIPTWALVGIALQHLLCFYPERPFARLAAHKKRLADRLADLLLVVAAGLAWHAIGSGSLSDLAQHVVSHGANTALQASALCLALAVVLRTALLPVHGWLIQVMEAPTPVSALLHAGVVNLGGFVLIRFATLLDHSPAARWFLVATGLATAVLAGLIMLTRITIKVRLAWSTVAQMGFMVMECGLGLYTLAALHLLGHSLYKAHHFLSASGIVRTTRLQAMWESTPAHPASLLTAPLAVAAVLAMLQALPGTTTWPWWWTALLALAWAPVLWLPAARKPMTILRHGVSGLTMVTGLSGAALLVHTLPLDLHDTPATAPGLLALIGLGALYASLAWLQWRPEALETWRRWSYAGFYIDEYYTRLVLLLWPVRWAGPAITNRPSPARAWTTVLSR